VYSGLSVVYEVPESGSATLRFYAGGRQVAEKTGDTITYLHQDHLGSTRLKTDASGDVVFSGNYQPFGVEDGMVGSEEFRYTGKPSDDETGLVYFGARFYLPEIGRFITEDPASPTLSDPQSLNRYVYCRNNPNKYTDPDGKSPLVALILLGIAAYSLKNMVEYSIGALEGRYKFDARDLVEVGIEGAVTGGIVATGAVVGLALGAGVVGVAITSGLAYVAASVLAPAIGGVYETMYSDTHSGAIYEVAEETENNLETGWIGVILDIAEEESGVNLTSSKNVSPTDPLPNDYLDAAWRH